MKSLLAILLMTVCLRGFAGDGDLLATLIAVTANGSSDEVSGRVDAFVEKLGSKSSGSETYFLKRLFRRAHSQFLKHYRVQSEFNEMFTSGNYDCLTATSLFAALLDRLGYQYTIYETNHHIFMIVQVEDGEVLIESTDPINGFETDEREIERRILGYKETQNSLSSSETYEFQTDLFQAVNREQLAGLLLYNQAVKMYNSKSLVLAAEKLKQAHSIYANQRNVEFAALIIQTASVAEMNLQDLKKIHENLIGIFSGDTFASAN